MADNPLQDLYLEISRNLIDQEVTDLRNYVIGAKILPAEFVQHASAHQIFNQLEKKRKLKPGDVTLLADLLRKIGRHHHAEKAEKIAEIERKELREPQPSTSKRKRRDKRPEKSTVESSKKQTRTESDSEEGESHVEAKMLKEPDRYFSGMTGNARQELYLEISRNLTDQEFTDLHNYVSGAKILPTSFFHYASAHQIFNQLEKEQKLKPGDLSLLVDLLRKIGRHDYAQKAEKISENERKDNPRQELFLELSWDLTDEELKDLHNFVSGAHILPKSFVENASAYQIFNRLEEDQMLKTGDLSLLADLLRNIGRHDYAEKAEKIAENERKELRESQPSTSRARIRGKHREKVPQRRRRNGQGLHLILKKENHMRRVKYYQTRVQQKHTLAK